MKFNLEKIGAKSIGKKYENVRLIFNNSLSKEQKKNNILAKVQIIHPAFSTRATIFKLDEGKYRVSGSSKKSENGDWFNIVTLNKEFRSYIVREYKAWVAGERKESPWYLSLVGKNETNIPLELSNEELDIVSIEINDDMSTKQSAKGMLAKIDINTSIGALKGYTVSLSQFAEELYGMAPTESDIVVSPGFKLSHFAEAQILAVCHNAVEGWSTVSPAEKEQEEEDVPPIDEDDIIDDSAIEEDIDINEIYEVN